MAQVEEQYIAAGAQIIWVLTESQSFDPGTAELCRTFMSSRDSDQGWCVGDSQTMGQTVPGSMPFQESPFAIGRGFDIIVSRRDMQIRFVSTHGTPRGNDNLTGAELLVEVERVISEL